MFMILALHTNSPPRRTRGTRRKELYDSYSVSSVSPVVESSQASRSVVMITSMILMPMNGTMTPPTP